MADTSQASSDVGTFIVNLVVNYPVPSGLALVLVGAALLKFRKILFTVVLILPIITYLQANLSGLLGQVEQRTWLALVLSILGWGGFTLALSRARLADIAALLGGIGAVVSGICLVGFSLVDINLVRTHTGALIMWGSSIVAGFAFLAESIPMAGSGLTVSSFLLRRARRAKDPNPPQAK